MEDLVLAVVTFVASIFMAGYLPHAGMAVLFVVSIASMLMVGYLAYERGRSQRRWVLVAFVIGPFAIPMLYLVAAASAFRKTTNAPTTR